MTTFLLVIAVWTAMSIPVSVATGRLLARRSAELDASVDRHPAGRAR